MKHDKKYPRYLDLTGRYDALESLASSIMSAIDSARGGSDGECVAADLDTALTYSYGCDAWDATEITGFIEAAVATDGAERLVQLDEARLLCLEKVEGVGEKLADEQAAYDRAEWNGWYIERWAAVSGL